MFGFLKKKATATSFWDWLTKNTDRIQSSLARNPQGISEEIGRMFERSFPGLVWELSPAAQPPWLFCVSADGNPDLFPAVINAVNAAPTMPGWQVQAFRPRGSLTVEIEMGHRTMGYEDIWCQVQPLAGGVHVTLRIRGLTPELGPMLGPAALILLDNAVGEYDAGMKIKRLDQGPLPEAPQRTDSFFPLSELPPFLDRVPVA